MESFEDPIHSFVELYSRHIDTAADGLVYVESWIEDKQREIPDFIPRLATHCRTALLTLGREDHVLRGCVQFLSVIGTDEDIELLRSVAVNANVSTGVQDDASEGAQYLEDSLKSLEQLLDEVKDRRTFIVFADALIRERGEAEKLERSRGADYLNAALGWQNIDISAFLEIVVSELGESEGEVGPSWSQLAHALYMGKIYE
jgi:hypothetical protein